MQEAVVGLWRLCGGVCTRYVGVGVGIVDVGFVGPSLVACGGGKMSPATSVCVGD